MSEPWYITLERCWIALGFNPTGCERIAAELYYAIGWTPYAIAPQIQYERSLEELGL